MVDDKSPYCFVILFEYPGACFDLIHTVFDSIASLFLSIM